MLESRTHPQRHTHLRFQFGLTACSLALPHRWCPGSLLCPHPEDSRHLLPVLVSLFLDPFIYVLVLVVQISGFRWKGAHKLKLLRVDMFENNSALRLHSYFECFDRVYYPSWESLPLPIWRHPLLYWLLFPRVAVELAGGVLTLWMRGFFAARIWRRWYALVRVFSRSFCWILGVLYVF